MAAFNNAMDEYGGDESRALAVAHAAAKRTPEKDEDLPTTEAPAGGGRGLCKPIHTWMCADTEASADSLGNVRRREWASRFNLIHR